MTLTVPRLISLLCLLALCAACSKPEQPQQLVQQSDELVGAALFKERCRDCHGSGDPGRANGPDLAKGKKLDDPRFLEQVIREPARVFPGTIMPQYRDLSARQVTSLVQYVGTLK